MTPTGRARAVMVGPSLDGRGGISSVVAAYSAAGFFERLGITYLASHHYGTKLVKLRVLGVALWRLWALLLRRRVSLVHLHSASGVSFWRKAIFAWSAYAWDVPVLMHVHNGAFDDFHARQGALGRRFITATLRRARRVIVLSPSWIERLRPVAPSARWVALPNPVLVRTQAMRAMAADQGVRCLFLGRLEQAKGVFDLIAAFATTCKGLPALSLSLSLAGEGDLARVRAFCEEHGVSDRVALLGWVEGGAKEALLDGCDIFVLPSYVEGLPVSMLEAMAAGLAVIVSNVGSVPEVIAHGEQGWLVVPGRVAELAGALESLAGDAALRRQMGDRGRLKVQREYAAEVVCAELARIHADASQG